MGDVEIVWGGLPGHAGVALARQTDATLTAVAVGANGVMNVAWVDRDFSWRPLVPFGPPVLEPGAGVALAKQNDETLVAATVGRDRRMHIAWVRGIDPWQPPVPIGGDALDPRSGVALAKQNDETLVAAAVGHDRRMHVGWVRGAGQWEGPVPIGGDAIEPASGVALAKQNDETLVAAAVGQDRRMYIAWVRGAGRWEGPVPIGGNALEPASGVALAKQNDETLVAAAIGQDHRLYVAWVRGGGSWEGPIPIGGVALEPTSGVALAKQNAETLVAAAVGHDGRLHLAWVRGTGQWEGPVAIGDPVLAPGAGVALSVQDERTFTCFAVGQNGVPHVAWVRGTGRWEGPVPAFPQSQRVCQLTGNADPDGLPHINDSTTVGIAGTDLGFPVEHGGRLVFLFGDQFGIDEQRDFDPIGLTDATEVRADGFPLSYVTEGGRFRPLRVRQLPPLLPFETPTGGFSDGTRLWAFLNKKVDGTPNSQTLLASAPGPEQDFDLHYSVAYIAREGGPPQPPHLAGHHLLNLAGARRVRSADWPGLGSPAEECVLVCGQAYWQGAHLGCVDLPLAAPAVGTQAEAGQLPLRYFAGLAGDGSPTWSTDPGRAFPLFGVGAVTFVDLSWVPGLQRWIALYTEGWGPNGAPNPAEKPWRRPILLRSAPAPWGPWSEPVPLIHPVAAYPRWLHDPDVVGFGDGGIGGWLYCPLVIDRFTRWDDAARTATIHYLLSAGDPYNVHLMRATLRRTG